MAHLTTLFYDGDCGICHRLVRWIHGQETTEPIRCLSQQQAAKQPEFENIDFRADAHGQLVELVLQTSEGRVYRDTDAYLHLLNLIKATRPLAKVLDTKALRPFVRRATHAVINNRQTLSGLLGLKPDAAAIQDLPEPPRCAPRTPAEKQ